MELVSTPGNPAPPDAIVVPVATADGVWLRVARWQATGEPRGTVALFTGRGEFIEKYFEVIRELLDRRFAVVATDWRGQGMSGRPLRNARKGHVDDFSLYERDIDALFQQVLQYLCPPPFFALGHSMGGAILLAQARAGRSPFERLVLTAPMIDLHGLRFPRAVRAIVEVADILGLGSAFIPGGGAASTMLAPFEDNPLTADRARFERNAALVTAAPQLAIGDPTVGWLNAAFRTMERFADPDAPHFAAVPALVFTAGDDRIVSSAATQRLVTAQKSALAVALPGARHEILQERDHIRALFWAAFDAFLPGQRDEGAQLAATFTAREEARAQRRWWRRLRAAPTAFHARVRAKLPSDRQAS